RLARGLAVGGALGLLLLMWWRLRLQRRRLVAARAREAAEEARRRTERRLDDVMAAAPDGIVVAASDGCHGDVHEAGCALLGYTRAELIGRHVTDLNASLEQTPTRPALDAIRRGERLVFERQMRCADGSILPVEISGSQLHDGSVLGIVRDLSARKRAEEALRDRDAQLQQT